ncbi:hypothetical protein N9878_00495 [bacterium]|nr:hypothetical protein [bacterium]
MAVEGDKSRAADVGHHLDGYLTTYDDGTTGFVQSVVTAVINSTDNTTTTILTASSTFTGEWEQNNQPDVMVSMKTDVAGTLYFDFSNDGVNADSSFPVAGFEVAAGIHEFHTAVKGPRFFRLRYVNNGTDQTYMRLYCYFGTFRASNTPLNQSIGLDSDGASVRPTDFQDEVRRGKRSGVDGWNKFGYIEGINAASGSKVIWKGGATFTPMETAETFTITYDGTGGGSTDGAGTVGATQLYFYYIDADGLPQIMPHTLGTDGSDVTSFTGLGINRCVVAASGTGDKNSADITVTATSSGTQQAIIPATQSVTQQCIFFTGSNHDAVAKLLWANVISSSKAPTINIKGYVFNRQFLTRYEIFRTNIDTAVGLVFSIEDPIGFNLSPTDILYFEASTTATGGATVDINMRFSLNQYART